MGSISLRDGEKARQEITKRQQKEILRLYNRVYKDLKKKLDSLSSEGSTNSLRRAQLDRLTKELKEAYEELGVKLQGQIESDIQEVSEAVVEDIRKWLQSAGISAEGAYSYVPTDIVELLSSGKLYGKGWTLSKAIWGDSQDKAKDIDKVVAEGLAANKSAYDIAKDLEKYVDPSAKKDWEWSKVYPGTSKRVDYNAQRLARTMSAHAYQQSMLASTKDNPFVKGYRWKSGHTSRTCDLCNERDGKVYTAENIPMDHPNGTCTFIVETPSMMDVSDQLAAWAKGESNPELDKWYKSMMGKSPEKVTKETKTKSKEEEAEVKKEEIPEPSRREEPNTLLDFRKAYSDMVGDMGRAQIKNALLEAGVSQEEISSQPFEQLESKLIDLLVNQRNQAVVDMRELQSTYKNIELDDVDLIKRIFKSDIPNTLNHQSTFQKFVYSTGLGNGKPQVVDQIPTGSIPLFRGVKDSTLPGSFINDLTRYDDMSYMGNGIFGDGIYMTTSEGAAKTYGGNIMKAAISPNAKIVDYDVIYKEMMDDGFGSSVGTGDVSTYALLKGYDVIYQKVDRFEKGEVYYNIINREVLIIEK